jgi:predicted RNA-binding Zn-ribbon protein involved in translation (DUF1610 family)
MAIDFENKKYPSVTIQGVLLAINLLLFEQSTTYKYHVVSIIILISLFFLQAINHRFYYFFPVNKFTGKMTPHADTVILYLMTLSAFLFTLQGITDSLRYTIIATAFIVVPPFVWRLVFYKIVRNRIAKKLSKEPVILEIRCPKCGRNAKIERRVKSWNHGEQKLICEHCNFEETKQEVLNIG